MIVRIETRQESNGLWYVAVDTATGQETSYVTRYGRDYLTSWVRAGGHMVAGQVVSK